VPRLIDDIGRPVAVPERVERVVSLVPSLTESLAVTAPGMLVGATDWCVEPPDLDVARVGGTKSPDVDRVVSIRPDLVVANEEENREVDLDRLRAAGLPVWVTAPRTVAQAIRSLGRMLAVAGLERPGWLDDADLAWRRGCEGPPLQAFVPIWRRPWMALGRDTFAGDVLARLGVQHVHRDDPERYPRVDLDDVRQRRPDLVVLSDEPYAFSEVEGAEVFGDWDARVVHVSGRDLTWYGPSLGPARDRLAHLLRPSEGERW
jgi:ABC-type Fe3+-hydroxamate transport system substrate-binding protein